MSDPQHEPRIEAPEPSPVFISHVLHTLRRYLPAIFLSVLAVTVGYMIVAVVVYLRAPSQRVTYQAFRLDFTGATAGQYPNGTKFSSAEIVSAPVLNEVYHANGLNRYMNYSEFVRSLFVQESNRAYEELVADYQARLADTRLTPVDRDRLQRQFQEKRDSLAKNEYALYFVRKDAMASMPDTIVRKVLADVLTTWANKAVNEQHVLLRMTVLTPKIIDETSFETSEPLIAIHVLRSKIKAVLDNINQLAELPSAELVRTRDRESYSLAEIRLRLEDVVRFRLEPLVALVRSRGQINDHAAVIRFMEAQLAYDERQLLAQQERATAAREALVVYSAQHHAGGEAREAAEGSRGSSGESLAPVLDATFLDRFAELTSRSRDMEFRQMLVNAYRQAVVESIPLEQTVAWEKDALATLRSAAPAATSQAGMASVRAELDQIRAEVRGLIEKTNAIHDALSRH
ncbi:MAG TPA: hypothetical protein VG106_13785, partial [Vicinamibacterales bacterium]|nr:hypothetical protein [Vicinamibacterales bacterium]